MAAPGHYDREQSYSANSPFNDQVEAPSPLYPPQHTRPLLSHPNSSATDLSATPGEGLPYMQDEHHPHSYRQYDAERGHSYPLGHAGGRSKSMPTPGEGGNLGKRASRNGSWDLFAGVRKFERGYEQFDTRNASESHLRFADGDVPKTKVRRASFVRERGG